MVGLNEMMSLRVIPSAATTRAEPFSAKTGLVFLLLALLTFTLMSEFYVGFQAGDDKSYLTGALGWLNFFPYVGDNHWVLRHTITIPTAIFVKILGLNEFAVSLSNILYFILFITLNAWFVRQYLGIGCAAIATLLVVTLPGFIVVATYLDIDIPELLFVSVSFWFFRAALDRPQSQALWIASGVFLGMAFITRETSASMALFFGLLFLFKPIAPRVRYLSLFGSFAVVLAADWLYLTVMTGNPLYRYRIDFNHDQIDRFGQVARVVQRGGLIDSEGNISVNVFIDPVLNLFVSQKYSILFWLLVPAMIYMWKRRREAAFLTLMLLAGLALVSFLFIAANPKLYLVPRYFVVTAWAASIIVAWWLFALWFARRRGIVVAVLTTTLFANGVALAMENTNPRFIERQLVAWVAAHPYERVYTDVETIAKSKYLFRFAHIPIDTVLSDNPPLGATFFYSPDHIEQCRVSLRCRDHVKDYQPGKDWQIQKTIAPTPLPIGRLVLTLGADTVLPYDITRRLLTPGGVIVIYRTGDKP